MNKQFGKLGVSLSLFILIFFSSPGWAAAELELIAPGGGEMDLRQNVVKYYAVDAKPVEARWEKSVLNADYLEYYRETELIDAKDRVKLTRTDVTPRVLACNELQLYLRRDFLKAGGGVTLELEPTTSLSGESLEWDHANDKFSLTGKPVINYKEWQVFGEAVEGHPDAGAFTILGPAKATDGEAVIKAGCIIFNRKAEELILRENPIFLKGENELTATEIIYDLKTKKLSAKGLVKSKIIKQ